MLKEKPEVSQNGRRTKDMYIQRLLKTCSPDFLDFLERCFPPVDAERGSAKRLAEVSNYGPQNDVANRAPQHHMLRHRRHRGDERLRGCLLPLVHNALHQAVSPCWMASERDLADGRWLNH